MGANQKQVIWNNLSFLAIVNLPRLKLLIGHSLLHAFSNFHTFPVHNLFSIHVSNSTCTSIALFQHFYVNISLFVAAWNMIHFISGSIVLFWSAMSCSNINNPFLHYFFVQLLLRSSNEANMFFNSVEGNLNSPSLMIFGQDNEFMKSLQFNKSVPFL